jgi:topoisomerase IA-like protein
LGVRLAPLGAPIPLVVGRENAGDEVVIVGFGDFGALVVDAGREESLAAFKQ